MSKILGLDLGTNSIGWALIEDKENDGKKIKKILDAGVRIIPMDTDILNKYDQGNSDSPAKARTKARGVRRLYERSNLRRERLHRVLRILGFLPTHYEQALTPYGKFANHTECKLAWAQNENGKYEFLFQKSFEEMLTEFRKAHPELLSDEKKIPYDWTIYYLRKKALTQKVNKEELAWILLNFNQKRGYYQFRDDEEVENTSKTAKTRQYFERQIVTDIIDTGETDKKGLKLFNVHLKNGLIGKVFKPSMPIWKDKEKSIIVTVDIDKDGNDKRNADGTISCRFQIPTEEEWDSKWTLLKLKAQQDIDKSKQTVGEYIYQSLLNNPSQKIIGKLVRVVDRHYYKDELRAIMKKQTEYHPELQDKSLYTKCIEDLYHSNTTYRASISGKDFIYLFVDNIIFYQRQLKSKKSLIADCPYEKIIYKKDDKSVQAPIKCIAKSHPLFQEFRLWQFLSNIKIYQLEKDDKINVDVTDEFLTFESDYVDLFKWLNDMKDVGQKSFLAYPGFNLKKKDIPQYRWNYVENDKKYPCNETRAQMLSLLKDAEVDSSFLTQEKEEELWYILYSINDKTHLRNALVKFAKKNSLNEKFADVFQNAKRFKKEYGSYSTKAIKKLLPLMRRKDYWKKENIDNKTLGRIEKLISGEADDSISERTREKAKELKKIEDFKGLPTWLACYVVYDIHAESKDCTKWKTPEDIDSYLKSFKQHSLRNPIVEQVVMETLRTVRDIWKEYGKIDNIHIELGRNMKQTAEQRKKDSQRMRDNEKTNLRIKQLLQEFVKPEYEVYDVRPYSQSQQEKLRIYEDGVFDSVSESEIPDNIKSIKSKLSQPCNPSSSDVMQYKCWLEQHYRSPYTDSLIPLSKLFTSAYEIDHIIPQSRYFDDSLSNKIICESEVNKLKSNDLGLTFIKNNHGSSVTLTGGKTVNILSLAEYKDFVKKHYAKNRRKRNNLLLEDIPDDFINRQLNDSRYISKFIMKLMSNIVREDGEQEAISKNVIPCTGGVTSRLKLDWGINDVWNDIILPRFERMNKITGTDVYTTQTVNGYTIPTMPLELQKGFSKKRIDHRHHAMDAIVIACADRDIVNYLNNESASKSTKISRLDLRNKLCKKETDTKGNYKWLINKPWDKFSEDCYTILTNIIVSFKQNLRVINKTTNRYQRFKDGKKTLDTQVKGDHWAIRKAMHKETVYGEVHLNLGKKKDSSRYFAVRKQIDKENIGDESKIAKITDTGIQKILRAHLEACKGDLNEAFSPEGIERMNANTNIKTLNGGKAHKPIYRARIYEDANKFSIGKRGNKGSKFVEDAEGTHLFFAIYETEISDKKSGKDIIKRTYNTIPLSIVIERQKEGLSPAPDKDGSIPPKYVISPNDLVYLPTDDDIEKGILKLPLDRNRIYKIVSASDKTCYFLNYYVANVLKKGTEFESHDKFGREPNKDGKTSKNSKMIKDFCIPIKVNRLGKVIQIGNIDPSEQDEEGRIKIQ